MSDSPIASYGPHRLRVFNEGRAAFEQILARVDGAEKSISVRAFLWRDDHAGNRLGEAILRAADRGVQVTIHKDRIAAVYEYAGGNRQSFFHKRIAPAQGIQALVLGVGYRQPGSFRQRPNPLARAISEHKNIIVAAHRKRFDHSKLFVFDDRIVTLGSMGIGDNHHKEWVDVMVEMDSPESVTRLRSRIAGRDEFDPSRDIDFLLHSRQVYRKRTCPMLSHRLALISRAKRSLVVEMAYLGDRRFTQAIRAAIARGVHVTMVTAAYADVNGNVNRATCNRLLKVPGADERLAIYTLPRMVHSKIVVIDGEITDIGSANFTALSHGVYDEINVYVRDAGFANAVEGIIAGHAGEGNRISKAMPYRRIAYQIERAVTMYQSRRGARRKRGRKAASLRNLARRRRLR